MWEKFSITKWLTGRSWVFKFRALRATCIYCDCVLALYQKGKRPGAESIFIFITSSWVGANIFNFNKRTKATQGPVTGSGSSSTAANWPSQNIRLIFPDFRSLLGICYCIPLNVHLSLSLPQKSWFHFKIKIKLKKWSLSKFWLSSLWSWKLTLELETLQDCFLRASRSTWEQVERQFEQCPVMVKGQLVIMNLYENKNWETENQSYTRFLQGQMTPRRKINTKK